MDHSGHSSNNKAEQNEENTAENQSSRVAVQEDVAGGNSAQRAISESDAMVRDIKEGRLSGFVGSSAIFNGELNFIAMARIDGHLTGKVTSEKGTLIVGSDGQVDANVSVATAIINGEVNGDIIAVEYLELKRTAKVVGNIQTPRLIMADGAILEGNCSMLKVSANAETPNPPTEKKSFEPVGKDEKSSDFTLEVV